jgi:hypothetical protein
MRLIYFILILTTLFSCKEDEKREIKASISLDYNKRIIYEVIDNYVNIIPSTGNHSDIIVKFNDVVVKGPKFEDYYCIKYNTIEDILLEVFYIDKKNGQERKIAESEFSVQGMPSFEPLFAYQPPGSIVSKEIFTPERILDVKIRTSYVFSLEPVVVSFDIELNNNGRISHYSSDSNTLTKKQSEAIMQCKSGDVIYFRNVKVKLYEAESSSRKIRDFAYIIE